MSLFFKERIDEQTGDPSNGEITFLYPWIISNPTENGDNAFRLFFKVLLTSYNINHERWYLHLTQNSITIALIPYDSAGSDEDWMGSCFVSYKLFYDNDMRFEFYSSNRVSAARLQNSPIFQTPDGFLTKFNDASATRKISKLVITVEFVLPTKVFFRPYDNPASPLCKWICDEYPKDMESNFVFQFLKQSDYVIQCSDGSTPASRCVLNVTSKFMKKHFKKSFADSLTVEFSLDVIKPLMLYLHSFCFEMPKFFDLEFADQLLKALKLFQPFQKRHIICTIERALCKKFVEEHESLNFLSLLPWLSIFHHHSLHDLRHMICAKIANKYYHKWNQTLPGNARNTGNPMFRDIFGSGGHFDTFRLIEELFTNLLFIKAILH